MNYYDLRQDHDTWKLTAEGGRIVFADEPIKTRALRCAVQIVSAICGNLNVHRDDGTIEEVRRYPNSAP